MRFFNTAGPISPDIHYHVPPLARFDRDEVLSLIRQRKYFVLHAPRQTGKTTVLLALRDLLNGGAEGKFRCVYANVEAGQAARENVEEAMRAILYELAIQARTTLGDESLADLWPGILEKAGPSGALRGVLGLWSEADPTPLVLLIDEIDSLLGDTLLAVLRQLRAGYSERPSHFPQSVVLCGVRDVRDCRLRSSSGEVIAGGSPFNVAARSLRLGDFTEAQAQALLAQHTEETDQAFTPEAVAAVWTQTRGQPWLVNALCADACFDHPAGRDRSRPIAAADILNARERLILSRRTHLDQLAHKLGEERVRRVVEPLLSGGDEPRYHLHDLDYVRDLGLVAQGPPPRIANPIYAEVVPRELGYVLQDSLDQDVAWYVDAAGGLDVGKLLAAFQAFFRAHSEHWLERFEYREAGPQLILQAFLQRVVNGGGRIERKYGLGRGRTDLLLLWPPGGGGPPELWSKFAVECKVWHERRHQSLEGIISQGLEQTARYMDHCGSEAGHLIVFDRTQGKGWEEKAFRREERRAGRTIIVWGT